MKHLFCQWLRHNLINKSGAYFLGDNTRVRTISNLWIYIDFILPARSDREFQDIWYFHLGDEHFLKIPKPTFTRYQQCWSRRPCPCIPLCGWASAGWEPLRPAWRGACRPCGGPWGSGTRTYFARAGPTSSRDSAASGLEWCIVLLCF